jgi:cytochrome c biogenesis protein CcdA
LAERTTVALVTGGCLTVGFIAVFGSVGLLAAAGATLIIAAAPWIMILVGALLAVLGIAGLFGRQFRPSLPVTRFRRGRGAVAMTGFGIAYAIGSLTCALPLFLAGVASTFTRLGFANGMFTFLAYALGMGVFCTAVALITIHASAGATRHLRRASRWVPVLANALEVLVGGYLIFYWIGEMTGPLSALPLIGLIGSVQTAISGWMADSSLAVGCVLGVVVVAATVLVGWSVRRDSVYEEAQHEETTRVANEE